MNKILERKFKMKYVNLLKNLVLLISFAVTCLQAVPSTLHIWNNSILGKVAVTGYELSVYRNFSPESATCSNFSTPSSNFRLNSGQFTTDAVYSPCNAEKFPISLTVSGNQFPGRSTQYFDGYVDNKITPIGDIYVNVYDDYVTLWSSLSGSANALHYSDVYGNNRPDRASAAAASGNILANNIKTIVKNAGDLADAAWRFQRQPCDTCVSKNTDNSIMQINNQKMRDLTNIKTFCDAVQARGAKELYQKELQPGRNAQWVDAAQTPDGTATFAQLCPNVTYK